MPTCARREHHMHALTTSNVTHQIQQKLIGISRGVEKKHETHLSYKCLSKYCLWENKMKKIGIVKIGQQHTLKNFFNPLMLSLQN